MIVYECSHKDCKQTYKSKIPMKYPPTHEHKNTGRVYTMKERK